MAPERVDGLRGGVVQVVDDHDQRRLGGQRGQQVGHRAGTASASRRRARRPAPLQPGVAARRRVAVPEQGQAALRAAAAAARPARRSHDAGHAGAAAPRPRPGSTAARTASGRPIATRTRSASGASRHRSPKAAHRTDSTRRAARPPSRTRRRAGPTSAANRVLPSPASAVKTSTRGLAAVDHLGQPARDPGQLGLPPDERRLVAQPDRVPGASSRPSSSYASTGLALCP